MINIIFNYVNSLKSAIFEVVCRRVSKMVLKLSRLLDASELPNRHMLKKSLAIKSAFKIAPVTIVRPIFLNGEISEEILK